MKNKEKYAKEIADVVCNNGGYIAIDTRTNTVCLCSGIECKYCVFNESRYDCVFNERSPDCVERFKEWANSEAIKKYELTENEVIELKYFKSIGYSHLKVDKSAQNSNRLKAFWSSGEIVCYEDLYNDYVNLDKSEAYTIDELLEKVEVEK